MSLQPVTSGPQNLPVQVGCIHGTSEVGSASQTSRERQLELYKKWDEVLPLYLILAMASEARSNVGCSPSAKKMPLIDRY